MAAPRAAKRDLTADNDRQKITYIVGRLHSAVRRRIAEVLGPFELSVAQYTTLSVLQARGQLSNAQLANRAFITPQAMNEVVQGLEARKLVTRQADPTHARIVQLGLTPSGVDVLKKCDAAVKQLEQTMLGKLSPSERETLKTSLLACVQALESH